MVRRAPTAWVTQWALRSGSRRHKSRTVCSTDSRGGLPTIRKDDRRRVNSHQAESARARALWGKAQNYLEASLAVQPTAIAHAELARLFETLNRGEDADRHCRAGLALALAD